MLSEDQIRTLIVLRIEALFRSSNNHHRNHVEGQVRALIAVLTGKMPPALRDAAAYLDLVGIPHQDLGDGHFWWDDAWLAIHGFKVEKGLRPEDDVLSHTDFPD